MVKKTKPKETQEQNEQISDKTLKHLPDNVRKDIEKIKVKLDKFSVAVVEKLKDYITGIALIPPNIDKNASSLLKDMDLSKMNAIVVIDDRDSKKMPKPELKAKLQLMVDDIAKKIDKNIIPKVEIYTDMWQSCYDATYDVVRLIAVAVPIYDTGILAALKISELHKVMLLQDFSKYVVAYAIGGSIAQGRMTPKSDIDVFVIIDDTDVKRMTRTELRDKLRAIIITKAFEAANKTGIQNKIQVQVYILTEFWDGVKDANPVLFTFIRDGLPLYDRGIFMAWKNLLRMGRIKPSPEAISMYMSTGEQMLKRVKSKLLGIASDDLFLAIQTPTQGALMLYGIDPPTPKETPDMIEKFLVKKEKLVDSKFANTFKKVYDYRKKIEHGEIKDVSGKELDILLKESEQYLKRLNKLYDQINLFKQRESILSLYENTISLVRDGLKLVGIESVTEKSILSVFKKELIDKGKVLDRNLRLFEKVLNAKKLYDDSKLSKQEIDKIHKSASEFHRNMIEFIQRTRFRELERAKIRFKHGNKIAEMILIGKLGFIIDNLEERDKLVHKVVLDNNQNITSMKPSSIDEMDKAIADMSIPPKVFINERIFEGLRKNFGDVEILINY